MPAHRARIRIEYSNVFTERPPPYRVRSAVSWRGDSAGCGPSRTTHAEVGHCLCHRALCVVLARFLGCYEFGQVSLVKPIDAPVGRDFANDLVGIISSLEVTDGIRPIPFGLAGLLAIAQRFRASGGECH